MDCFNLPSDHPSDYLAFFKGTAFPSMIVANKEEWKGFTDIWDESIVNGLRFGDTLEEQATHYISQLTQMEQFLHKFCQKNGLSKKNVKKLKKEMIKEFGVSYETLQSTWFANVYILLKLKKIEDDEMNGFIVNTKNKNTFIGQMGMPVKEFDMENFFETLKKKCPIWNSLDHKKVRQFFKEDLGAKLQKAEKENNKVWFATKIQEGWSPYFDAYIKGLNKVGEISFANYLEWYGELVD